jgi:hypothetical protein
MAAALFSERMALIVVTVLGMAMCSVGIGQVAARWEWLHPMSILAYVIGLLILGIVGAALFNIKLPMVDSTRAAIYAVILLGIAKVVLTQLHRLFT